MHWCVLLPHHMIIYCAINKGSNRTKYFCRHDVSMEYNVLCIYYFSSHIHSLYDQHRKRALRYWSSFILKLHDIIFIFLYLLYTQLHHQSFVLDKSLFLSNKSVLIFILTFFFDKRVFLLLLMVAVHHNLQQDTSIIFGQSSYQNDEFSATIFWRIKILFSWHQLF